MAFGTIFKFAMLLVASGASITFIANLTGQTQAGQTQVGQTQAPAPPPGAPDRAAIAAASAAERDRELKQLGIAEMQPSASAYDIGKPGNANYDESKANPYPKIPDLLTMNDGTRVTTPAQWNKRREEIKALFDEDVYGKYPAHIPAVTWKVDSVNRQAYYRPCR
jgi:hypothetical protein